VADLVKLSDVKHFIGNDATSAEDYTLATMITAVSDAITQILGRNILATDYTTTFDGKGHSKYQFPQYPVTAVSSLSIDGTDIPIRTDLTSTSAAYVFNENFLTLIGTSFTPGIQNCTISYTAGYENVPASIKQACIRWIAFLRAKNDRIDLASKAMGPETTAYLMSSMPPDVRLSLSQWRRVSL
jgi:hypothetical protein